MRWMLPAKTFLLGEYAALNQGSAIILTTAPYFELHLSDKEELTGIHPDSPAGLWWQQQQFAGKGLKWFDPYSGCGGLGASSAQFLGAYLASCYLQQTTPNVEHMLQAYYQVSWNGCGLKPSGYDVIAQSLHSCVFINKQKNHIQPHVWPFKELSFLILHTGNKLATHHHLQDTQLPIQVKELSDIADQAHQALLETNDVKLIQAINAYHQKLKALDLVAEHSLQAFQNLSSNPEVLAIKGCGALGADTLLILTLRKSALSLIRRLEQKQWKLLATEQDLTANCNTNHKLWSTIDAD